MPTLTEFEKYFKSLQSQKISDITEHSHRPALKELVESYIGPKVKILHEPKREGKFGSPDFKITHTESIIGYIENKKIEENLEKTIKSEQIKKYQALSDNILITNYIDWVWIRGGEIQKRESLCSIKDIQNKKAKLDREKVTSIEKLIKSFLSQAPKEIADAKKLAEALAIRAKLLKDFLLEELKRQERKHTEGRLYQLYETFKTFVFHELTVSEFSDAFSQNLVYGLFLAKLNADVKQVNLNNAWDYIPSTFELIKELVDFLKELKRDEYRETKWIVEEILTIMNNLDLRVIQDSLSFTKLRKDSDNITIKDPYVYFYEDFLTAYDKDLREKKGVYYTPPPVVNFIVRGINEIVKTDFGIKEGFGDKKKITVLDFATGTGTFLVEILQQIFEPLPKDSGKKELLIREHVLKNIFGFEYLIAPYTISHLKLSQFLKDQGYKIQPKERLQILLTNTLEPIDIQSRIPFLPALTEESKQAQKVKDQPILIITGNPPYLGLSKNNGEWISNLIETYKYVDGKHFGEKKHWLNDDYVKFIRFAQDKMDKVEEGIVGIITNHSFIDNPTFRGMRQSLMNTFNQIYIVDLHGDSDKKEKTPTGGKDENVFDIKKGVAISIFVKKPGLERKIFHSELWGTRKEKYLQCLETSIHDIEWNELTPNSPFYLFKGVNLKLQKKFAQYKSIKDIFIKGTAGIVTGRDNLNISFTAEEAWEKITQFKTLPVEEAREKFKLGKDSRDWTMKTALEDANKNASKSKIKNIAYRPFDSRFTVYTGNSRGLYSSPQRNIMSNMFQDNIALITAKSNKSQTADHFFCSKFITETKFGESTTQSYTFPLILFTDDNKKISNFHDKFLSEIKSLYGNDIKPKEIFGYIYAILHSPTYRIKYLEFLRLEFPRVPFTPDKKLFHQLAELGNELLDIHLMEQTADYSLGDFIGKGDYTLEKPNLVFEKNKGKLYINSTQYFNDIPQEIFDFCIGGYQVLDKFLKDRKGRKLSYDEIGHLEKTIKAIAFTIDKMKEIDTLTKKWI